MTWEDVAAAVAANQADHAQRESLKQAIAELERTVPRPPAHAMALADQDKQAPDTFVFRRGDYRNKGPKVAPRPLGVVLASQKQAGVRAGLDRPGHRDDGPQGGPGAGG